MVTAYITCVMWYGPLLFIYMHLLTMCLQKHCKVNNEVNNVSKVKGTENEANQRKINRFGVMADEVELTDNEIDELVAAGDYFNMLK